MTPKEKEKMEKFIEWMKHQIRLKKKYGNKI